MLLARTQTFDQRSAILARLVWRNRVVGILRVAVPALGVAAFLVLMGQMWLSSLARQYGVSGIRIDRGQLVVETPQYSETGEDGSRYLVTARSARTPLDNPNSIEMDSPDLLFERPDKAPFHATAENATIDTGTHVVVVPGVTNVRSADGLFGTLTEVRSDMKAQITDAAGPVDLTFPDGSHLIAANMRFDGNTDIWAFDRATLYVPNLPKPKPSWNNVFLVFTAEEALGQ
jgi:hypothetical protein